LIQTDALSFILFNVVLESIVRKVQKDSMGLNIGEWNVVMVVYADDNIDDR